MDALSEWLRVARVKGDVFLYAEFSQSFCISSKLTVADCGTFGEKADRIVLYHRVLVPYRIAIESEIYAHVFISGQAVILSRNDKHLPRVINGGDIER